MNRISQSMVMTILFATSLTLVACSSGNVKPNYVSPTKYQSLECEQLRTEYDRIEQYLANGVSGKKKSSSPTVGVGIGAGWGSGGSWGLFPSISVNLGQLGSGKRREIAELLGQQDAIAQAAQFKNCPEKFPRKVGQPTQAQK